MKSGSAVEPSFRAVNRHLRGEVRSRGLTAILQPSSILPSAANFLNFDVGRVVLIGRGGARDLFQASIFNLQLAISFAGVAELVDAQDLKSCSAVKRSAGSTPALGTN